MKKKKLNRWLCQCQRPLKLTKWSNYLKNKKELSYPETEECDSWPNNGQM